MDLESKILFWVLVVITIAALFVVIFVPLSISDLRYYEMGFPKHMLSGTVDREKVYMGGRYFVGVDKTFKRFRSDAHIEVFPEMSFFNKEKLQVTMTCALQYFLRPYDLKYLHDKYNLEYRPVLRKTVESALKTAATEFTVREYRKERPKVKKALLNASRVALGGRCCPKDCAKFTCWAGCKEYSSCKEEDSGLFADVAYFQLQLVSITQEQQQRFLRQTIENEKQDTEQFRQQETIERKKTEQLRRRIENDALEVAQNATARASLLKAKANAAAKAIVEDARNSGLQIIYNALNIESESHKKTLHYVRVLRDHDNAQMYVNFKTLVATTPELDAKP